MINNRQNGRRRGRGGNNGGGSNNPRQGGSQGRGDSANRIDSRARGNANQLYEKYKNLARDAQMSGDRVNIEYYLQFADHYFRVLADQRGRMENDNQPRRQQPFDINGDDDDELMEGDPIRTGEQNGTDRDDRQQNDRQQNDRPQNDRPQGQGLRRDRGEGSGQQRHARTDERADQRTARDRDDRQEVAGQHRSDPLANGESLDERAERVIEADAPLAAPPRRRGRPRREDAAAPVDASPEAVIAADRLPPSLGISAANDAGDEAKPRRRTRRPAAEAPAAE